MRESCGGDSVRFAANVARSRAQRAFAVAKKYAKVLRRGTGRPVTPASRNRRFPITVNEPDGQKVSPGEPAGERIRQTRRQHQGKAKGTTQSPAMNGPNP